MLNLKNLQPVEVLSDQTRQNCKTTKSWTTLYILSLRQR